MTSLTMSTAVVEQALDVAALAERARDARAPTRARAGARGRRTEKIEPRSGAFSAADDAVVQVDDVARDREPEAGARHAAAALELDAVEALEHAVELVLGNADARVLDLEPPLGALAARAQITTVPALRRELERVADQVEHQLLEQVGIALDRAERGIDVRLEHDALARRLRAERRQEVGDERRAARSCAA